MRPRLSLPTHHAIVGLGANLGDTVSTLRAAVRAIDALPDARLVATSRLYDTAPLVPDVAMALAAPPAEAQPRYRNAAVRLEFAGEPERLLDALLAIERAHGRVRRKDERWGPRTLDLDLLLFGDETRNGEFLTLPHPRLLERAFVVAPLVDVAPEFAPDLAATLAALGGVPTLVAWEQGE